MSRLIVVEFRETAALLEAARRTREHGLRSVDAHTPFKVEGLEAALGLTGGMVRTAMLIGGFGMAAAAFMLQWYSAVINYPIDVGGRPYNSWPTFVISCFEVGVLAAGFVGLVAFLYSADLPRPHNLIFSAPGFERASQDRFFLAIGDQDIELVQVTRLLHGLPLLSLQEVSA